MNLRQLHIFVCIAKQGSITKAAKELFMTQPALSHTLHDLEEELHQKLFDRIGKRLVLNRQGAFLLKKAEAVLTAFEEFQASSALADTHAHLKIATCITIAAVHLPKILPIFHKSFSDLTVSVEVNRAQEVIKKLKQKEADIAFVEGVINDEELSYTTFGKYELVVVCAKNHRFAREEQISIHDVLDETWLLREKGSAVRDTFDALLQLHRYALQPYWTSVDSQALLQAVMQNMGISILPDVVVKQFAHAHQLHCLRFEEGPLYNEMHMVTMKGSIPHESDVLLLKLLAQSC